MCDSRELPKAKDSEQNLKSFGFWNAFQWKHFDNISANNGRKSLQLRVRLAMHFKKKNQDDSEPM